MQYPFRLQAHRSAYTFRRTCISSSLEVVLTPKKTVQILTTMHVRGRISTNTSHSERELLTTLLFHLLSLSAPSPLPKLGTFIAMILYLMN